MAAAALKLFPYLDTQFKPTKALPFHSSTNPLLPLRKHNRYSPKCCLPSSSSTTSTVTPTHYNGSFLDEPFRGSRVLANEELEKLKALESFVYFQELESGSLSVRVMRSEEMGLTVGLLALSFAESMFMSLQYEALLRFFVEQYLIERRALIPHAVTLVGFYREEGEERGEELAGTVEVCFDKRGANSSPPTPTAPKNSPYICNMTVTKDLRRRGIGWHLLKASEELITQMASSKEVYLHCRMIDEAPFNMYIKAGYNVVQTDSIFILLTLQRRKHLMCKKLPVSNCLPELDMSESGSLFACIRRLETGASYLHNNLSTKPDLDGQVCSRYQLRHGTHVLLQLLLMVAAHFLYCNNLKETEKEHLLGQILLSQADSHP